MKFKKTIFLSASLLLFASFLMFFSSNSTELIKPEYGRDNTKLNSKKLVEVELVKDISNINILDLKTFRFSSVDGKINVDSEGNLIVDRELRHWLDFYLSALGELELEQVIAIIEQKINQLPSPGREQAHQLFRNYLGYKTALSEYDERAALESNEIGSIEQLQGRLDWQSRLRRQWLSSDAVESFWKMDEVIDDYALQKLVIRSSDLNSEEKAAALEALEQSLPDELSSFKKEVYIASDLLIKEEALDVKGDSNSLRKLRIEEVGMEAADRLERLDVSQGSWNKKLEDYRDLKEKILSEEGLSEVDKQEQLDDYRNKIFTDKEQLRIDAALQLLSAEE